VPPVHLQAARIILLNTALFVKAFFYFFATFFGGFAAAFFQKLLHSPWIHDIIPVAAHGLPPMNPRFKGKRGEIKMKEKIHPKYEKAIVRCVCGETFETGSTKKELRVEICSKCHPFFTGKQKLVDSGGRVDRFKKRFGM